jgi:ATP-dependent RNA helicase DeaD
MTFSELGLREEILQALTDLGFESPTPIQEEAIPQLLEGERDLVGLAQTGTGKTAAFGLPLLEKVNFDEKYVQAVVIAPTRELCVQISKDLKTFSKHIKGAQIATIYGGASIDTQAREVKRGAQVVVATPGRLIDMLKRRLVKFDDVRIVVLDEADEMLNMGFKEDIDSILDSTPEDKSVWLFSATMPKEVAKISKNYMDNPIEVTVGSKNSSNENITHQYYCMSHRDRYGALKRILDINVDIYGLVFCRTRRETQEVADNLMEDGYNAQPLHGELSQGQRDKVMQNFRKKSLQVLVATDVAARGLDVDDITHVINYNLPDDIENYTHRSGRTARAGKKGVSMIFVTPKEVYKIKQIEKQIQMSFNKEEVPTGEEVCKLQLFNMVENVQNAEIQEDKIGEYLPAINELFADSSKEEVIAQFVSAEFNKTLAYYSKSNDINKRGDDRGRDRDERNDRGRDRGDRKNNRNISDEGKQRFFMNMGLDAGLNKGAVVRLVCQYADIPSSEIGRIDLFNEFSFFDVSKENADIVLDKVQGVDFNNASLHVEKAADRDGGGRSGGGGGRSRERSSGRSGDRRSGSSDRRSGGDRRSSGGGDRRSSSRPSSERRSGGGDSRNKYSSHPDRSESRSSGSSDRKDGERRRPRRRD